MADYGDVALAGRASVAILVPDLLHGGVQRAAINLLSTLRTFDFRPLLISRVGGQDMAPLIPPAMKTTTLNAPGRARALAGICRVLVEHSPDILMTSGAEGVLSIAARALTRARTKIVIWQHGPFSHGV